VGFEPTISAGERPQTYAFDRAGNGTDSMYSTACKVVIIWNDNITVLKVSITVTK
jgi:hypothetical protein